MSGPDDVDQDWIDDQCDPFGDGDEEAEAEMNCGMGPTTHCSLAGTEWCDWSCPFSDGAAHNRYLRKTAA